MGCASNFQCNVSGMCELVPTSRWQVTITTGTVANQRADGSPWNNITGLPNPFACLTFGGTRYCSDPVLVSRRPTWNFALPPLTAQTLLMGARAELIDSEFLSENPICAPGTVSITPDSFVMGSVGVGCSTGQFTFTLRPM